MKTNFKLFTLVSFLSLALTIVCCEDKKSKEPIATYTVDAVTNKDYEIEGTDLVKAENPSLTLKRGETYKFVVKASGHPFFIKTEKVTGKVSTYDKGVTNNGANEDTLLFSVPKDAPDLLYYVCQYHKLMSGELKIVD